MARRKGKLSVEERAWRALLFVCRDPCHPDRERYGDRALFLHPPWREFPAFLEDVGERPNRDYRFARIDPREGWVPRNARWMTRREEKDLAIMRKLWTHRGQTQSLLRWSWQIMEEIFHDEVDLFLERLYERIGEEGAAGCALSRR